MKINYEAREELRGIVKQELKDVPNGQRIHLDKEILEQLLFEEEFIEEDKKGKIPVWTGEFLRKIDLSEISFEGVCWDYEAKGSGPNYEKYKARTNNVDFSYTNANIDLSKAYPNSEQEVWCYYCDFEGVDLSKNDLKDIKISFFYSNLAGTKLNLQNKKNICDISTLGCNLSGLDLSWLTVNLQSFTDSEEQFIIEEANFTNTGLKIEGDFSTLDSEKLDEFNAAIREGRLVGCYINGKLIKSKAETQILKEETKQEYAKMKANLFFTITQSISEQKKKFK